MLIMQNRLKREQLRKIAQGDVAALQESVAALNESIVVRKRMPIASQGDSAEQEETVKS